MKLVEKLTASAKVEIKERDMGDDWLIYYVRAKKLEIQDELDSLFGVNIETIKQLSKEQFEDFISHKENFEKKVLWKYKVIVTTVGTASSKVMIQRRFKRVVMDEATMIKEQEAFMATLFAEQIVLVGDQKQLGPTYGFKVNGSTSLFSRLINAGHPYSFLDTQYRMHETLMQVPNMLFYENQIQCGYVGDIQKVFLYSQKPFLFIDVANGQEKVKGTSFVNFEEVQTVVDLTNLCLRQF